MQSLTDYGPRAMSLFFNNMNEEIKVRFEQFHTENPSVYKLFDTFAHQAIAKGHKRMSADMLMHRVRWETYIVTTDKTFKVNNSFTAHYSRLWMENNPDYQGLFETRSRRPDENEIEEAA